MVKKHASYIPGMCNIGPAEIRLRRLSGIAGLVATAVLWLIFILIDTPSIWRLIVFIPATVSAVGLLQAWLHFCVNFGMRGLFNVSESLQQQESVDQQEYRRKDQQKALTIIAGSSVIGVIVALAAYLLA